jgi:hypothetical protein
LAGIGGAGVRGAIDCCGVFRRREQDTVREVLLAERSIIVSLEESAGRMLDRDDLESIGLLRKTMRHGVFT